MFRAGNLAGVRLVFSRSRLMRRAEDLKDGENPTLLPGIEINAAPDDYHPIWATWMVRWIGMRVRFGGLIERTNV
jgi:branched-chain amino acid transport system substrate-binding protein